MPPSALDQMVDQVAALVRDERVLHAMREVPRARFVPEDRRPYAYEDHALNIGEGQTISQPTMVGMMTEALHLQGGDHVLEIGTGSGYQAAILARLARDLVSVEVVPTLRERARDVLADLGVDNVRVIAEGEAGGGLGAPDEAPFDAILVTAAVPAVPPPLLDQLRVGRRLVLPVGSRSAQQLTAVTRTAEGTIEEALGECRFVPLVGEYGFITR